jgi:hypothetical protein
MLSRRTLLCGLGAGLAATCAVRYWPRTENGPQETAFDPGADQVNCVFDEAPANPFVTPDLKLISFPTFRGASAIWGATGRDARGHIWFGVSASGVDIPSAHLFEYIPETGAVLDRGDVVSELRRSGIYRAGEGQMKIHSKILQGDDGYLYFASMDEQGERSDGSRLPTWGGHLWRLRLTDNRWEHLLTAPEALIAVAASPGFIYALGYFDHVLYQYNCKTATTRSVRVGAAGGHITRNFLADQRGHVFVPRLQVKRGAAAELVTTLVEFNPLLQEIGESPLGHYTQTRDDNSHGLVGVQSLADYSLAFNTDQGYLYRVRPRANGPAVVEELGWFHPKGKAYVASLFTYDGMRFLMGISSRSVGNEQKYEWVVYDLATRDSLAVPVTIPPIEGRPNQRPALYGSVTRDNKGNFYLGGVHHRDSRDWPILLQVGRPR